MTTPFDDFEVEEALQPSARTVAFPLERALSSVLALEAIVPPDAFTADALGTERIGNAVVIGEDLVLTIGYLIMEAEQVTLIAQDGRRVAGHVLGVDHRTGLGLVHALEPLGLPALPLGDSRNLHDDDLLVIAGGGGRAHAMVAEMVARQPFAGYWEYRLDEALFTAPAHPHWSGAAVIGPTGELVGLTSLRVEQASQQGEAHGLNMSVPAELLAPILEDLKRGRPPGPSRPWLGVFSQEVGGVVVVAAVAGGGPASKAGLKRGDVVMAVAGQPVRSLDAFYKALWALGPAGVTAPLRLSRQGDEFEVEIRTADRAALLRKPKLN